MQLTREGRIANCRISIGRMIVKNAFRILAIRFRVLLGTMEQRTKVIRDIVLTCLVSHNKLRTHKGRVARTPNRPDELAAIVNEPAT